MYIFNVKKSKNPVKTPPPFFRDTLYRLPKKKTQMRSRVRKKGKGQMRGNRTEKKAERVYGKV